MGRGKGKKKSYSGGGRKKDWNLASEFKLLRWMSLFSSPHPQPLTCSGAPGLMPIMPLLSSSPNHQMCLLHASMIYYRSEDSLEGRLEGSASLAILVKPEQTQVPYRYSHRHRCRSQLQLSNIQAEEGRKWMKCPLITDTYECFGFSKFSVVL